MLSIRPKGTNLHLTALFLLLNLLCCGLLSAQQITGVWKGKVDKKRMEVKIIQKGDSLTGTSYYHELGGAYRRYSIKGYFDAETNSAVWWDDQLIEEKGTRLFGGGKTPLLSVADFNCPGGGEMYLNGKAAPKADPEDVRGPVDLTKTGNPSFPDEWDFVIDNYTVGANDPELIDSIGLIAFHPPAERPATRPQPAVQSEPRRGMVVIPPMPEPKKEPVVTAAPEPQKDPVVAALPEPTIEKKFTARRKTFIKEIPLEGDSLELRFYDNAEIDGDSISLFLNDRLIFSHIRLTGKAYTIKLATADLEETNELIMVAENLGTIPPNTSFMVAISGGNRYEARLSSTENASAMVRLRKPPGKGSRAK